MTTTCNTCGSEYERIAQHWSLSSCDYPTITPHMHEVITGSLMGDLTVGRGSKNPRILTKMITKEYLEYLDSSLSNISKGIRLAMTSDEKAEEDRLSGFNKSAKSENYSDVFAWYSICHPELSRYSDWYKSGEKVFSDTISLTPTVLKNWYCCDGNFDTSKVNGVITFGVSNEIDRLENLSTYFRREGLPEPSNYKKVERKNGSINCVAQFTVEQSATLFDYMGDPLPGFSYKWPTNE